LREQTKGGAIGKGLLPILSGSRAALTSLIDHAGRELVRRFVRADEGLELAYTDLGQGDPVVLLHGTLTTLEDMTISLADHLVQRHRVIAFDRPGFGRSTVRRFLDAGIWRQAERLSSALAALGVVRPVVVGHSLGASIALAMAVRSPSNVKGVVALAPLVLPEPRLEQMIFGPRAAPVAGDVLQTCAQATTDRSLFPLLWRAMWLPQTMPQSVVTGFPFALAGRGESSSRVGEDAMWTANDLVALAAAAPRCNVPACILGGDRDLVVNNGAHGRTLAAVMPNGMFIDLPGLGHMAHHFAGARVAELVQDLSSLQAT
jgi:pimeloyl-ACP methyl ester carboxylesterase